MKIPSKEELLEHKYLKKHKAVLKNDVYWSSTRRGNVVGVVAGSFAALIPMPFQMLLAVPLCLKLKGNIILAIIMVWLTNPITMPFIVYGQYLLGAEVLGIQAVGNNMADILNSVKPLAIGVLITLIIIPPIAGMVAYKCYKAGESKN